MKELSITKFEVDEYCFGEMPWWAARTSNPVDAARHSGSIPPLERFLILDQHLRSRSILIKILNKPL